MKPGVHERKWEIDSLCYPIRLAYGYWKETGDVSVFDKDWQEAMRLIIKTFKEQQRLENNGPYKFERTTSWATDGVPLGGYGYPVKPNGLICSMFRPSDDATVFPFLITSNWFAVFSLEKLKTIFKATRDINLLNEAGHLQTNVLYALQQYAVVKHKDFGKIYAYEINGLGSFNLMDDANIPSQVSLSYLSDIALITHDFDSGSYKQICSNTRKFSLSDSNPFFFKGKAAEGIGGPHVGMDYIWPMSIIMRGLTSTDDMEIKSCLDMLQKTHAGTGFMHESFHKDDPAKFTRKWFAWANTLFGEFVWKVYKERPHLLK